jgi:Ca-activated chloride channel family protein
LIGYENRALRAEDFNDDKKDAGEIGAGHTVTALYEILTPEQAAKTLSVDELRYQKGGKPGAWQIPQNSGSAELATVKLRYKAPQGQKSRLIEVPVKHQVRKPSQTSDAFRFSAAVASFGMLLRDSQFKGSTSFALVQSLAQGAQGSDEYGHKREFIGLVSRAAQL